MFSLDQFDYLLPDELVAQSPIEPRDACRLLVLDREKQNISHYIFRDLVDLLDDQVVLVRNNTKVFPARLFGRKETGGKCEVLLVRQSQIADSSNEIIWECLVKPGLRPEQHVHFEDPNSGELVLKATCLPVETEGYTRLLRFEATAEEFLSTLFKIGHTPLPPYIDQNPNSETDRRQLYQTTYAQNVGSAAAPTAGLHFTAELDRKLLERGVKILEVTLHVGLGTFLPVQDEQLKQKKLHQEMFFLNQETVDAINAAKAAGKKIIAVGTTTTRVLESCVVNGVLQAKSGTTELFIQPGDQFQVVDGLITNFHVPKSSLLMLVSAFTSAPNTSHLFSTFADSPVGQAYQAAIAEKYRFFSFGDAMLIW